LAIDRNNEQLPAISVIVPSHNSGDALARCLSAINSQTGLAEGALEVVLVDDGSTDASLASARGLYDRLVVHERNRGAAIARNSGAREASAGLLVFVDADVLLEPGAVAAIHGEFERDPELGAAVGRYTERPAVDGVINVYHNAFTRYHHDLSPREIDWFWGALGAVRREAFSAVGGFDERYQGASAEDMALGLTLASAGFRVVYCPEAEGAHAHDFTLLSMLENDYKKAVLGTKLRIKGRLPRRAPGFANLGNVMTAPILVATALSFLASFWSFFYLLLGCLLITMLLVGNERYYKFISSRLPGMVDYAIMLHWLQMFAIMAGAVGGVVGWLLRRPPYGRPGWI